VSNDASRTIREKKKAPPSGHDNKKREKPFSQPVNLETKLGGGEKTSADYRVKKVDQLKGGNERFQGTLAILGGREERGSKSSNWKEGPRNWEKKTSKRENKKLGTFTCRRKKGWDLIPSKSEKKKS